MQNTENLIETLHKLHCDNAVTRHFAHRPGRKPKSTMPVTSFVFEFFLYNSIYQYDWENSLGTRQLVLWRQPDDGAAPQQDRLSETQQQAKLERFMKERCRSDLSILRRALDPITYLEDLDGGWTDVSPDARVTSEQGRRFFEKLTNLRDQMRSDGGLTASSATFDTIGTCRHFVYQVRNNVFHGSKSIGDYWEKEQRRRIEVYDVFLKSLVSLFFLSVEKSPVAADLLQNPVGS